MTALPCVVHPATGLMLARARTVDDVREIQGDLYFHPDCVNRDVLVVSDRLHTCPRRGRRHWVDARVNGVWINDVSWTFTEPSEEFAAIHGWFGFSDDHAFHEIREDGCPSG
jgi:uncharacterized protein (DUF427 family)